MNTFKKITAILMVICMLTCFVGCGDELDRFKAAGVYIIDYTGGKEYKYIIDHEGDANTILDRVKALEMTEDATAKPSTAYLFLRFYDKDVSKEIVFTIYDNGVCCISREYDVFYKIENGITEYMDLVNMYEQSQNILTVEKYKELHQ